MSKRYASDTSVSVSRSRDELETTIAKYGGTHFAYATTPESAVILFVFNNRKVRFTLVLPDKFDKAFTHTPTGRNTRTDGERIKAWEQACRARWRALNLVVKAKMEAIECGITTFEEEFLAHFVTISGETVGQKILPELDRKLSDIRSNQLLLH